VPMVVGGNTVSMLVDTGGIMSMLSEDTVKALNLREEPASGFRMMQFGGLPITQYVTVNDVFLGGLRTLRRQFYVAPPGTLSGGVLAPDAFILYDADFDFGGGKLNIVSPNHCPGRVVYWTGDATAVDFQLDDMGHIRVPVQIDGKALIATLDTGATVSYLSLEVARLLFGITDKSPDLKEVGWMGPARAYSYPFKTLTMQGLTVNNPAIRLAHESDTHVDQMILGMDVLRQLHLYIAYRERRLYVSAANAH